MLPPQTHKNRSISLMSALCTPQQTITQATVHAHPRPSSHRTIFTYVPFPNHLQFNRNVQCTKTDLHLCHTSHNIQHNISATFPSFSHSRSTGAQVDWLACWLGCPSCNLYPSGLNPGGHVWKVSGRNLQFWVHVVKFRSHRFQIAPCCC